MANIRDLVTDTKVNSLYTVVESSGTKYLCFTRLSNVDDAWVLCVSDGCELWRLQLDMEELDAHRDLADVNSLDTYLTRFRSAFTAGDIQVSQMGVKVMLSIGQGNTSLDFELYEAKAVAKKVEFQTVLFRLAETASDLETKLDKAENQISALKAQKTGATAVGIFDMDTKKKKGQPKTQPKAAGMSVINPGSKKRKAAKGVEFD